MTRFFGANPAKGERRVYVFTKPLLTLANNIALKRGYNRALRPEVLALAPEDSQWMVELALPHEHAAGKPVEMHMRCGIYPLRSVPGDATRLEIDRDEMMLFVDTDMDVFEMLPYSRPVESSEPRETEPAAAPKTEV